LTRPFAKEKSCVRDLQRRSGSVLGSPVGPSLRATVVSSTTSRLLREESLDPYGASRSVSRPPPTGPMLCSGELRASCSNLQISESSRRDLTPKQQTFDCRFRAFAAMSRQELLPVNPKISSRNSKHWKDVGNEVLDAGAKALAQLSGVTSRCSCLTVS
jgi:hypothetical protein